MHSVLAYAETGDSGALNLAKVLGGLAILTITAFLAAVLIATSRARRHRQAEAIMVAALFWGVITAGSSMYAGSQRLNWSKEYATRIESGYYDPRDMSDKPKLPIVLWSALGIAYAGMLTWSLSQKELPPEP